ncbi:hypothetical protein [Argonema antarcticum]|uniref:hypothetical protein n=1 Tax=Argonema antarcticum TaxID=2942763 RepID=UPI0020117DB8|nr:hypothetical protein [Argonema antarcticum]MCL1470833.1 hypothetical protein [Argonema antarcticum A004/B2]
MEETQIFASLYLTEQERQEFFALGRQLSGFQVKDGYAYHLGESWKLPDDSPSQKKEVKSEVKQDAP